MVKNSIHKSILSGLALLFFSQVVLTAKASNADYSFIHSAELMSSNQQNKIPAISPYYKDEEIGPKSVKIIIELSITPAGPPISPATFIIDNCETYAWPDNSMYWYGIRFQTGSVNETYAFRDNPDGDVWIRNIGAVDNLVLLRCVHLENGLEVLSIPDCYSTENYFVVLDPNNENKDIYRVYMNVNQSNQSIDVCAVPVTANITQNTPRFMLQPGGYVGGHSTTPTPNVTTLPNPFNNLLEVTIPGSDKTQDVNITLYDLQGRQVLNQQFPGGAGTYNLTTTDILPGVYTLHARAGEVSQVLKVVKTQ